jgi:ribosomal protein L11 methyltransferase
MNVIFRTRWTQIALEVSAAAGDVIEPLLAELGAIATAREDAAAQPWYEESPGETSPWRRVRVTALFEPSLALDRIRKAIAPHVGAAALATWSTMAIEDRDWVRAAQEAWRPMRFGQRLWICPSWCEPPDAAAVIVRLDPGGAFGTGSHASTAQCLEWLEGQPLAGRALLDYGCGSGILALAALALGAERAWACDIDPQALAAAAANAAANALGPRLWLGPPQGLPPIDVDLVVANILSGTLAKLAPELARHQRQGGELLLAGILAEQKDGVLAAYAPAYAMRAVSELDGWVLLHGDRGAAPPLQCP